MGALYGRVCLQGLNHFGEVTDRLLYGLAIELVCRARQQGPAEIHVRLNGPRCVAITLDILEMDSPKRDHVVERIHISRLFGNVHQRRAKIGFDTAAQSDRKRRRVLKDFSQRIRQDLYLFGPEGLRISDPLIENSHSHAAFSSEKVGDRMITLAPAATPMFR